MSQLEDENHPLEVYRKEKSSVKEEETWRGLS
jgi:hypothetical protein